MAKYFGTDGIRGKSDRFTTEFIQKVAKGLTQCGDADKMRVMIGGDTRESSEWIIQDFEKSLETLGVEYGSVGVLPTPAINFAFYEMGFDYAIDITASHNPADDNGIKIFERGETCGTKLRDEHKNIIEEAIDDGRGYDLAVCELKENLHDDALSRYMDFLREYVGEVNFGGLRIGLDCANGAMSVVGGKIFEDLGAEVVVINNNARYGREINAGCGSTHPEELQRLVVEKGLDFGAAFDGDGDRCIMVDGNGEIVDGDQMIALLAEHLGLKSIAVSVMANQGLAEWATNHNVKIVTTPVGDQYIAEAMARDNVSIGGEQNGHVILPRQAMGDGMLTALMVTKAVAQSGFDLAQLASTMRKYPQVVHNMPASATEKQLLETNSELIALLKNYQDKLDNMGGKLLVRPSGTEDLIRITMWGQNEAEIAGLAQKLADNLRQLFNKIGE